ncbi:hypothetical protein PORCRE_998 [Porphyromonas crevioricanis JCM 15906]|uniref:Uncharacterized protein n=1 Tax=Porphyromonas crevioricanis JCM 15906 TaxID=1305617 RepID=T1CQD2_9PORP|nr:hypothetical protein PORCRE_998 [Porphyromonas crevioricanis JCM 15906]GAD06624.1 hypothetical protein PORCAN_222 [Porphyromonas crevioricanis JCM 13913]
MLLVIRTEGELSTGALWIFTSLVHLFFYFHGNSALCQNNGSTHE